MRNLAEFFERCYVISLPHRGDRRDRLKANFESTWPFAPARFHKAVDGNNVKPPSWWSSSPGAWGSYRSHARAIEECLNEQVKSVLLLEDDVIPCENFVARTQAFVDALPDDWDMAYLGGALKDNTPMPKKVNDHVYRAEGVNLMHAVAISEKGLPKVYERLHPEKWSSRSNTADRHLSIFHSRPDAHIYVPRMWLLGQDEGMSDVCSRNVPRLMEQWSPEAVLPAVVAVVGVFRSGTSCIAGLLHTLGVSMGRKFYEGRKHMNPKGFFESVELQRACNKMISEPRMSRAVPSRECSVTLRGLIEDRIGDSDPLGLKHPSLCMLVPEMVKAFPKLKIVAVSRDLNDAVKSQNMDGWWPQASDTEKLAIFEGMLHTRDRDISMFQPETLWLDYEDVLSDSAATVKKLVEFVGLTPSASQLEEALKFVDPGCSRVRRQRQNSNPTP